MSDTLLYYDTQGRGLFLSTGIGDRNWGVYFRKPNGSLKRVVAPALALTPDRADLERRLHAYAARKGWHKA